MTKSECILWKKLQALPPELDLTFRRQHPVHPYILDFACLKIKLAIELDGFSHDNSSAQHRDEKRNAFLASKGYTVLRFTNDDLIFDIESVLATIIRECIQLKKNRSKPSPLGGRVGWGPRPELKVIS